MKQALGHTMIGWANIILIQWLFTRISWTEETDGPNKGKTVGYGILFPVVPLSGWTCFKGRLGKYIPLHPGKINVWGKK